ncbi:MAG TPA: MBOAT family O-acyltransferase [Candidatus Cybelea sp.]|jgi:alginate O-acetyltransferase complex protein AlgI|nr:MBOAT family O-acyltransferase [Candidatus Cybelea sp.]
MIFNTWDYYLLFLIPSAIACRAASPLLRPWVIFTSGGLFFTYFSYTQFGGVAGAACLGIFLWESLVSRFYRPSSWICWFGVTQTVLFLALFKYRNFLTGLVWDDSAHNPLYWRNAFLPLGISFFTFEFIHYAVDRYRNRTEEGSVGEYLAFILFFPTMVAGPIKRYQDFLPKLRSISREWVVDWQRGVTRILTGLVKKFAVADVLTAYTSHLNWTDISRAQRGILPLWLFAYGIKIYADFSAYSDIAIGSARLFGIRVPENFDWPYLRTNITDFWRHWHMSLTNWLIDYIYIPLGGSRAPGGQVYANILVTMLVSGIWHGAGIHFIIWGLLHGILLAIRRAWRQIRPMPARPRLWSELGSWLLTYVAVNVAWAFFCMDVHTALFFFRRLLVG